MTVIYQQRISRADLQANPTVLYVFGDNMDRVGRGGQAKEMRGEPNAVGIPTKWGPYMEFTDANIDSPAIRGAWRAASIRLRKHLDARGVIVVPLEGIGTGLANLPTNAPAMFNELKRVGDALGINLTGACNHER